MKPAIFVLLALMCASANGAAEAATRLSLTPAARLALRASAVPVLLPNPLPPALGTMRSVSVISADRSGYYVGFSPLADCSGGLSCAFFHVAGFSRTRHLDRSYRADRAVRLADGTRAFFRGSDCSGSSCTEASLIFERSAGIYEIDAKLGVDDLRVLERAYDMLRLVN